MNFKICGIYSIDYFVELFPEKRRCHVGRCCIRCFIKLCKGNVRPVLVRIKMTVQEIGHTVRKLKTVPIAWNHKGFVIVVAMVKIIGRLFIITRAPKLFSF